MGRKSKVKKKSSQKKSSLDRSTDDFPSKPEAKIEAGFKAGDLILEGMPIVFTLKDYTRELLCSYCLAEEPAITCKDCNFLKYCNEHCQNEDYYHRFECKKLQKAAPVVPKAMTRYLAEAVTKYRWDQQGCTGEVLDCYAVTFKSLESCRHLLYNNERFQEQCKEFEAVSKYLGQEDMVSFMQFGEIYGKVTQYMSKVYAPFRGPVAVAFYLGLQLLKHACSPNSIVSWHGRKIEIRMLEDLPIKDFLLVTVNKIGYVLKERSGRIRLITSRCMPVCACRRCSDLYADYGFGEVSLQTSQVMRKVYYTLTLLKSMKAERNQDVDTLYKICTSIWDAMGSDFGKLHYVRAKFARKLCQAAIFKSKYQEAKKYCVQLLQFYDVYYGTNHVRTASAHLLIGLLDVQLGKGQTAKKHYEEAIRRFEISLGTTHLLYQQIFACFNSFEDRGWTLDVSGNDSAYQLTFLDRTFAF